MQNTTEFFGVGMMMAVLRHVATKAYRRVRC